MGQLQCVSILNKYLLNVMFTISGPCSDLPPLMNGGITYTGGLADSRPINTIATFTCDNGYTLTGGSTTRTCGSDGVWSGFAPRCQHKWNGLCTVCLLSVLSPIQLTALTYPYWWMGWLCTVLDPLTTDLSALVLYTPASMATLSLEGTLPGSVWVEGAGMGHLQLVKVNSVTFVQFVVMSIHAHVSPMKIAWIMFGCEVNVVMLWISSSVYRGHRTHWSSTHHLL